MSYSAKTKRDGQTDGRTDRQTDRQTDGQTDGGRCNISRPGPPAPREITNSAADIMYKITEAPDRSSSHILEIDDIGKVIHISDCECTANML